MKASSHGDEAERRELAQSLPAPTSPGLPPTRYQRLEVALMHEITRVREQRVPARGRTRRWSLVAVPVGALAAATALVVNVIGSGSGPAADGSAVAISPVVKVEPASAHGVSTLLTVVADAAAHQKTPLAGPHQFVYVKSMVGFSRPVADRTDSGRRRLDAVHGREIWIAQSQTTDGLIRENGEDIPVYSSAGYVDASKTPGGDTGELNEAQATALPKDPDVLLKKIYALTKGDAPGKNGAAFNWIGETVGEAIIPSDVTATIWRAAARIPGVVMVNDATDAAGRHGQAVAFDSDGERTEYIFDRTTHLYLGERSYLVKNTAQGKAGKLTGITAVLARGVVDKKGVRPETSARTS
ncbi:CU044_5270 family protein [Streptomyces sp. NPDC001833]|uniref:CU044_5270 family protein n=1 Tax=Streptomyces sp. NPDC001833 TaxID=3154658 RepID=UPI003323A07E